MYKITIEKNKKATCVLVKEKDIFNEKYMILLIKKCVNSLNRGKKVNTVKYREQMGDMAKRIWESGSLE